MKKIKLALVSLSTWLLPVIAFAQISVPTTTPATIGDLPTLIGKIETLIWIVFGGIAVVMFVVAGIYFLTAGGEPEKVQKARSAFIWGVAGVVVAIIAFSIVAVVNNFIG